MRHLDVAHCPDELSRSYKELLAYFTLVTVRSHGEQANRELACEFPKTGNRSTTNRKNQKCAEGAAAQGVAVSG